MFSFYQNYLKIINFLLYILLILTTKCSILANIINNISISSDNQIINLFNNTIKFSNNVKIKYSNIIINANKVIGNINHNNNIIIYGYGSPLIHIRICNNNINFLGESNQFYFNKNKNIILLINNVNIYYKNIHIYSKYIVYTINKKQILLFNSSKKQVHILIKYF
ncbi:MAG: hypothetical protein N4Q03_00820 [Candidatus Lightella neohaematopini]|nr:hypothetical protein [Candidatus Lightella neohaematopini]MCV2531138.1 hypothetical protein [Candidatus Lightella neohaematopini]